MEISEQELRAMVREAIARHGRQQPRIAVTAAVSERTPATALLTLVTGGDPDGAV